MRLGCQRSWEPTMTGKMGYRLGTYSELKSQRLGLVLMFYCLLGTFSSDRCRCTGLYPALL